ncbi:MAG: MotA/TolQ/ExbB proton channel family protein [Firmicutes bacterium]|nr:MotA/TolQ/ExbB proton channel family protein [Bacillota bacterium]
MHSISSGLLIPTIVVLLLLLALTAFELGALLVEVCTERRRKKMVNVAKMIDAFQGNAVEHIMEEVERSELFRHQKEILEELISHARLPAASREALARRLLAKEERRYTRITDRTDLVARLAPMFGLMGTLIPLGPGMIALGQGDTQTLADSLLIAFDTTVTGLAAAGVAFAISRLRKRWYEEYLGSLETLMESLLEVFDHEQEAEREKAYKAQDNC